MTLTGRFSALFLAVLGMVLVGFSTAMYVSARVYLHRQVGERLGAALAVLAAAAEVHGDGVEWERQERLLVMGEESGAERLRWVVLDHRGGRVDRSRNWIDADLTPAWFPRRGSAELPGRLTDRRRRAWRVSQRRIGANDVPAVTNEREEPDPRGTLYPALILTVFAPLEPTEAMLAALAWTLFVLSTATWLFAVLLCRRLSRHALAPLARMVGSARGLDASDTGWHLEQAGTGDELDELGHAFNDLLRRLHAAYEGQRRFGSDASHQLRTPLTVLIGQIEVALRRERSEEEYRRVLKSALNRALQLGQILDALLFLARAEGDADLPARQPFELNRWVTEHLASAPDTGAPRAVYHPAPGRGLWIRADPPLLGQLLDNLLDNARKYGPPTTSVRVETREEAGAAVLAVEDDGPGIPAADVARIFEPFYRAPEARLLGTPGVGLGLAIVQRIASAFGGRVEVRNDRARGCRIEVWLPTLALGTEHEAATGSPH